MQKELDIDDQSLTTYCPEGGTQILVLYTCMTRGFQNMPL